ncbi:hypothetical protein RF11_01233 [Thelohanellus kitauei]|uniref:ISXO2-like transposase domain-containing protein n=1 Tax=Thelohanellus kitauei TaxID=669202 RepID=A0A0C2N0T8_THEKT|nr:hypothetical protein RF11_01233 [Thelohanellus kitauei]
MQYYKYLEDKYEDLAWRLKKSKLNLVKEYSKFGGKKDVLLAPCPDNKQNGLALIDIISQNVNLGSLVITVSWKGYKGLKQEGWNHLTVNHVYNFVDPFTGSKALCQTSTLGRMEVCFTILMSFYGKKLSQKPSISFLVILKHAADLYPPPK